MWRTVASTTYIVVTFTFVHCCIYVENYHATKGSGSALFQEAGIILTYRTSLTLEPSPKIFGLLTAVGARIRAVICLS